MLSRNNSSYRPRARVGFVLALLYLLTGLPAAEEVLVTGSPASPEFLQDVLKSRGWDSFPVDPLPPGESWLSPTGDRVINLDWIPPVTAITALSDHPEKVTRRGGLFFGGLTELRPLNFQYYHLGKLVGEKPNLSLVLTNPGSEQATVHLSSGVGKPSLDYFSTGHTNNVVWFRNREANQGELIELPPGASREVFYQPLPFDYVVSGNLKMTLLNGPPLDFAFVAPPDAREPISLNNLLVEEDVHSRGFYPVPLQLARRSFKVGDGPLNLVIGAVRQQTFAGVRELRGDYGVEYRAEVELLNPTDDSADVQLSFNPRGGAATATLVVDGTLLEIPVTQAFESQKFHSLSLPPRSRRLLVLETIPEGASSYPVRIVIE
jgi:hypothetical protein